MATENTQSTNTVLERAREAAHSAMDASFNPNSRNHWKATTAADAAMRMLLNEMKKQEETSNVWQLVDELLRELGDE